MKQTRLFSVVAALLLFGGTFQQSFSQIPCSINSVDFSPRNQTFCETPAVVDFSADIDTEKDSIFLHGFPPTHNFGVEFTHNFPTENNGCLYALRITGSYSLWSNPDQLVDARYRFDPDNNLVLRQDDPEGLDITTPDYFSPTDYNPQHEYWFFYEGDGRIVNIDFEDRGQYSDNFGDMTFDWFVIPCFDTLWTIDGIDFPGGNDRSFSWQSAGTYDVTLQITDILSGCSDMATGEIIVGTRPEVIIETTDACAEGETGTAAAQISPGTGTSPFQFNWSSGNFDAAFAENLLPGDYRLTVTDVNNCRDTIDFSILRKTPPALMIESFDPSCPGIRDGRLELLDGEADWTYSLDGIDFQFTNIFQGLGVGDYTLFVNDNDGCIFSEPATLTAPETFTVELPEEIVVTAGEPFTLTPTITGGDGNFKFSWLPFDPLDCPDCENPIGTLTASQEFTVVVFDEDGCSSQATVFVRIREVIPPADEGIFVPNAFSPNNDGINDFLTVFVDRNIIAQIANLSVYDRYGGLIFQNKNFEPNDETLGWNGEHAGKRLDPGVYAWFAELERTDGRMIIMKGEVSLMK